MDGTYKTHEFHQTVRGWSGIGYNYFIEKDGTVVEGRGLHIERTRKTITAIQLEYV